MTIWQSGASFTRALSEMVEFFFSLSLSPCVVGLGVLGKRIDIPLVRASPGANQQDESSCGKPRKEKKYHSG